MKKIALRMLAAVLVATLLVTMLAGCRRDPNSLYEPPEYVYVPEFIDLPEGVGDIRHFVHSDSRLFFSSDTTDEETWERETKLLSMNIDGTGLAELPNFRRSSPPAGFEDALGSMEIMSLVMGDNGNLWITEAGWFYRLDIPEDFDGEEWETWQFQQDLGSVFIIRKLDSTGAELFSIDISNTPEVDFMWIDTFNIDSDDNIYIVSNQDIHVLSSEGNLLFTLQSQDWINQLIRTADGSIAILDWGDTGRIVRKIDAAARAWGETVELTQWMHQAFTGTEEFPIVLMGEIGLYGLDFESGETVMLLNWIDSDIAVSNPRNVAVLPDERILLITESWDRHTFEPQREIIILTKTPYAEIPERTVLTLSTMWLSGEIRSQVVQFNRTNPNYRIHVIDYSQFNTEDDWQAGLTKLSTDIIAGNVPDILDVSQLPFAQYVARGLLVDLYELIDADPELSRDSFVESVFRAAEMDGGLYRVFPSFTVQTLVGNPAVVGPEMGWNMDEFLAVLDANPQADMPIGQWLTRESFFQEAVFLGIDEYVDWANGEVYFDTGAFAQLLELATRFPSQIDWENEEWIDPAALIAQGRQLMSYMWIDNFEWLQQEFLRFGGELAFKGFPTENRNGNYLSVNTSLAITTGAVDKDGAWEFLRTSLTADWQRENIQWNLPTNRAVFNEQLERAMTRDEENSRMGWINDEMVELEPLSRAQADQIIELIDSIGGIGNFDRALMDIINEGAGDFFNGRNSAQDVARIVQSKASILVSERS